MKTALLFGASGLVGSHLLNLLISNNNYSKIKLFVRSTIDIIDPKIEIIQTDFNNLENHREDIKGDDCFFCIGTTKKNSPDKTEYQRVELELPKKIANLLDFIISGKISNRQAKELFEPYLKSNLEAKDFIEKMGVEQVSDEGEIEGLINRVLQQNPKMVEDYKNGKDKLFGFFVGQVMKESKGKANPQIVNKILQDKLA